MRDEPDSARNRSSSAAVRPSLTRPLLTFIALGKQRTTSNSTRLVLATELEDQDLEVQAAISKIECSTQPRFRFAAQCDVAPVHRSGDQLLPRLPATRKVRIRQARQAGRRLQRS